MSVRPHSFPPHCDKPGCCVGVISGTCLVCGERGFAGETCPGRPARIRLLRGQAVIREHITRTVGRIILPDESVDAARKQSGSHCGTVLALGAPALTPTGAEVPWDCKVGDVVLFHWEHHEEKFTRTWTDGEPACWVPQQCIDGVLT